MMKKETARLVSLIAVLGMFVVGVIAYSIYIYIDLSRISELAGKNITPNIKRNTNALDGILEETNAAAKK